ncbi:hypothetical protein PROFUN_15978 [Planoprotostelium fungivorum]|uniref:Uncharacterized protein n=1 Tax=Planoprotostelium fungivorum TaxID=1890364 RepID=A0A2P6MTV6_9EUKA|nr:hypothetical protein PROFUN_15978 [Planoprotostelium fungivorum]
MQRLLLLFTLTWLSVNGNSLIAYAFRGATCSGNPLYAIIYRSDCALQPDGRYHSIIVNANATIATTHSFSNPSCTLDHQPDPNDIPLDDCYDTKIEYSIKFLWQEFVKPDPTPDDLLSEEYINGTGSACQHGWYQTDVLYGEVSKSAFGVDTCADVCSSRPGGYRHRRCGSGPYSSGEIAQATTSEVVHTTMTSSSEAVSTSDQVTGAETTDHEGYLTTTEDNLKTYGTETMDATNIKAGDSTKVTADENTEAAVNSRTNSTEGSEKAATEINSGVPSSNFGESGPTEPSSAIQLGVGLSIAPILLALFI